MKNLFLLFVCFISFVSAATASQPPLLLDSARKQVMTAFSTLDSGLKKAAGELGKTGLAGDDARRVLAAACGEFNYVVDCCTIDNKGKMITVEPSKYRSFEGKDISAQIQVRQMLKSHKPVFSTVFRSVEGYDAVDVEYPVFDQKGDFIGSISVMFTPEKFLGEIIKPVVKKMPFDIWAMEKGGRILYEVDPSQIGLNLFTAPLYKSYTQLVQLGRNIAKNSNGEGSYRFKAYPSGKDSVKKAYWQSVSLYGTEWRLVGIHLEQEIADERAKPLIPSFSSDKALEEFAGNSALKAAFATNNNNVMMKLLKKFFEATPGIYSVQWINAKGINRSGYPMENSLSDYDTNSGKAASDKEVILLLSKQQAAVLEAPLFEGRIGLFTYKPVFKDGKYLGMVYTIRLKADGSVKDK